ncbi:hypothetical protein ACFFVB_11130 [Formosa undariae]|uniref:DUF4221 domain-containing protein n=1 Tax=Formosa undariae TaxID=1325436 RepID=A0ABV5F2F8_9FLAO
MSIINTLFGSSQTPNKMFPKSTDDGEVRIENNQLICQDFKGVHSCVVKLADLQYAYIKVTPSKERYLFLFDHHQNDIPVTFKGFQSVYEELSLTFSFNDDIFFAHVHNEDQLNKQLWRRKHPKNYGVLDANYADYNDGFEIQSEPKLFVSWDITYQEIEQNKHIYFETSPYGQKLLKFKYPVRIGNVIYDDFQAYFDNKRSDVPVLYFYSDCYNDSGNDGSYYDLKHVLSRDLMGNEALNGYERDDQKNLIFNLKGIALSICYTYDSRYQYDGGNTSVIIQNHREYPELLMDKDYEARIVISDAVTFDGDFSCPKDYTKNERIKYRPSVITEKFKAQPVIWIDAVNNKMGCSANGYAQTFNVAEIESLSVRNILPARGRGGAELYIITTDKIYHSILSGICKAFDNYVKNIEQLTGKKVTFEKEYYDC